MSHTRRRYVITGRKSLRDGKGRTWNSSTPSWWNNLMHTRKRRAETRALIVKAMRHPDAADGLIWPLDRKPHWYFW